MMRNKRAIAGILAFSLMSGLCTGCGSTQSETAATENAAEETTAYESTSSGAIDASAYENILKTSDSSFTYDGKTYNVDQFAYYAYVDINQDGSDEIILSTTSDSFLMMDESALILANVDGSVVPIFHVDSEAGAELRLDKEDAALTYYYRSSGEQHAEVYQFADGEFKCLTTLDHWQPYHYKDSGEDVYHIDGEDATEDQFNKAWTQYYDNTEEIAYTSIN